MFLFWCYSMKDFLKSYLSLVKCNVFNHEEHESLELKRLRCELQSYTEKFKIQYEELERLNKVYYILDNNKIVFDMKQQ